MKDYRIENYIFSVGSLTADSNGRFDIYTSYSINGEIQKLVWTAGNHTATGSLIISTSGVGENILTLTSGTATGMLSENFTKHVMVYGVLSDGTTGSPNIAFPIVVNEPIRVVGSGLGNGTSGLGLNIYYS